MNLYLSTTKHNFKKENYEKLCKLEKEIFKRFNRVTKTKANLDDDEEDESNNKKIILLGVKPLKSVVRFRTVRKLLFNTYCSKKQEYNRSAKFKIV